MIFFLTSIGLLMSSILGGVFFAFSSFIMPALVRIPASASVRAMQQINLTVFHWSFMGLFYTMPLLCLGFIGNALMTPAGAETPYLPAAACIYLVGTFVITGFGNVPLNEKLASLDPESDRAEAVWHHYSDRWTKLNHIRTAACLITTGLFIAALLE